MPSERWGLCVKGKTLKIIDLYNYGHDVKADGWTILYRDDNPTDMAIDKEIYTPQINNGLVLAPQMFE